MSAHEQHDHQPEQTPSDDQAAGPPTQAQLYDDLRRIGQLEDQKHAIQTEIDERTDRLRNAIPTLDKNSLLYQMLSSSLKTPSTGKAKTARRTTKKTPRKKR